MPAFFCRFLLAAVLAVAAAYFVLPASAQRPPVLHREKVTITLNRRSVYFLDRRRVREDQITPLLAARVHKNPGIVALIRCDKSQPFSRILELADSVKQAGVQSLMFATAPTPRRVRSRR